MHPRADARPAQRRLGRTPAPTTVSPAPALSSSIALALAPGAIVARARASCAAEGTSPAPSRCGRPIPCMIPCFMLLAAGSLAPSCDLAPPPPKPARPRSQTALGRRRRVRAPPCLARVTKEITQSQSVTPKVASGSRLALEQHARPPPPTDPPQPPPPSPKIPDPGRPKACEQPPPNDERLGIGRLHRRRQRQRGVRREPTEEGDQGGREGQGGSSQPASSFLRSCGGQGAGRMPSCWWGVWRREGDARR